MASVAGADAEAEAVTEWKGVCQSRPSRYSLECFEHLCDLGSGACGSVTKVMEKETQEIFALKAIEKSRVAQHRLQDHVLREVETQRGLDHPNVVRLYDCFEDEQRVYLLLEYAPGGHLFSRIQKCGRLPDPEAAAIFVDVVRALVDLHERGIIHRDLKPENVLLFPRGHAKLADFGWCAELQSAGRMTFCGTMDYLSPEMVSRQLHDHRVDTWAVGVLLYEMLVGSPPFYAKSTNQSIQRILSADLRFPDSLSADAKELIQSLLQVEPGKRMALGDAATHRWVQEARKSAFAAQHPPPALEAAPLCKASPRVLPVLLDVLELSSTDLPLHTLTKSLDRGSAEKPTPRGCSEDLPANTLSAVEEPLPEEMPVPGEGLLGKLPGSRAGGGSAAPRPVPKIGGFTSLECLAGPSKRSARSDLPSSSPTTCSTRCSGSHSPSVDSLTDGAASFFGDALRPCRRAWSEAESSERAAAKPQRRKGKDFMLDTCLEPVCETMTARGEQPSASWNSAARPVEASATPWFAPIGDASPPARRGEGTRQARQVDAESVASSARSRETPRTWRETDTFSTVRSWVRGEITRQMLAKELDRTISFGLGAFSPKDALTGRGASKSSSHSTGTPVSFSSESGSFVSEGDFFARGAADADTPSARRDECSAALPVLLSRPDNVKLGFSGGTPMRAKR